MQDETIQFVPFVESDIYARILSLGKRGYPLWTPKLESPQLPEVYKKNGAHIGDVGRVTRFGEFDYLFNVCHGADHELNRGRVPEGFEPISNFDADGIIENEYHMADSVLSDPIRIHQRDIQIENSFQDSPNQLEGVPKEFGGGQAYSSTTSNGAILILPEGGTKFDCLQPEVFAKYAAENAASWYSYATGTGRRMRNGSLYLVTGFDKARAWGVATFRNANPQNVSLEFVPKAAKGNSSYPHYWFRTSQSAETSSGADDTYGQQSGSVFLRGYKIAIRRSWLRKMAPSLKYTYDGIDSDRPLNFLLNSPPLSWITRRLSSSSSTNH
ncbi:hypothetical protein F5878DRAFT_547974 [Lentinula raphanica]|uniref:Uncharacterized protein n=1 Tax=Lentinula raphanica TaxID=153919 RepID=A0AA38UBB2_9AGAR|nr:hypothetical protein F5878DRAFT_547974 [Lentinula raphanica]